MTGPTPPRPAGTGTYWDHSQARHVVRTDATHSPAPQDTNSQERQMVKEVAFPELEQAQQEGRRVLDVRGPEEYAEGHVPGAELLPVPDLPARLADLPRGEPVYVLCRSGNRSAQAAEYLAGNGIDARSVAGGTDAWLRSGRPVVTGSARG